MSAETAPYSTREHARNIPSLDGLRAFAVVAVILSHSDGWAISLKPGLLRFALLALGQGGLGVNAFFIISGFLITSLLLNEADCETTIDLKRFYFRRSLRIFPPYYVYLAIAAAAGWHASRPIPSPALLAAVTYTSDYFPYAWIHPFLPSWYTLHTWSLGVEEQFYLVWPFLLRHVSKRTCIAICLGTVLLAPLLRLFTVLALPVYGMAEQWFRLFHTEADALAIGCLLAFVFRDDSLRKRLERCFHPLLLAFAGAYLILCASLFTHAPAWLSGIATITAANVCLAYVIAYVVLRPRTLIGRVLNWQALRHVGLISYSLYLWQQLFLGPYAFYRNWLGNCLCVFACAEASFWIVERPSLRLRTRLEAKFNRATLRVRIPTR